MWLFDWLKVRDKPTEVAGDAAAPDNPASGISVRQPSAADYDILPLSYVADEDREAVREQLKRGLEPDLVVRADGKMALRRARSTCANRPLPVCRALSRVRAPLAPEERHAAHSRD